MRIRGSLYPYLCIVAGVGLMALLLGAGIAEEGKPVVGWRTDGTGKYPDATPVVEWSPESNVIWQTPMPDFSNATPIIVGDKLFVCSEPATLICVDTRTGNILWERTNTFEDMADAETVAKWAREREAAEELRKQEWGLLLQRRKLRAALQDNPDDADTKDKLAAAEKAIEEIKEQVEVYDSCEYSIPQTDPVCGYSSFTPTSDGEHVWTVFGTGMVVCHDLDGNRVWHRMPQKPRMHHGTSASPVLVGDMLLVHVLEMLALDKATGETLWQADMEWTWATPAIARLGDTPVVITSRGAVARLEDGEILAEELANLLMQGPSIEDGVAYFVGRKGGAFDLAGATPTKLWAPEVRSDIHYAAPVINDGLIYTCTQKGFLSVIDASNGERVYERDMSFGDGTCYPAVTMAGDYIYVSSDNGTTAVIAPGREYCEVARNTLEPFRSCPVFAGDRLYIRGLENLYCLGATEAP